MSTTGRLRERNVALLIDALRDHGMASRADLARATGLSRTTVVSIVDELDRRGLIVEAPNGGATGERARGRPAGRVRLHPSAGVAVGIFVGREDLHVALTDLSLTVLSLRHARFELDTPADTLLDLAAELTEAALDDAAVPRRDVVGAGVGLPSPIDPRTGAADPAILANWAERPVREEFAARLAMPVAIENDANLEALAEMHLGAARGLRDVIYVHVSWGIGGALIIGGRLRQGTSGLAGEFAHIRVREDGPLCLCGQRGCLGQSASGHTLLAAIEHLHGKHLDLDDLIARAASGDAGVRRVLEDGGREIGTVLASICTVLDPDAVIVGGELGYAGSPLLDGVRAAVERGALPGTTAAKVIPAELRALAGPLGAARLVVGFPPTLVDAQSFRDVL